MDENIDTLPMDLKASAEVEVRKLQDMVKELERQNELLRHTQNGSYGGGSRKRESLDLEEVTLINLNESADDLEDSWLYESPVKQATPVQKSISLTKWVKSMTADGLEDVRKCLIDKLDDIEGQQEITKVRLFQKPDAKSSSPQDSLFFQPKDNKSPINNNSTSSQLGKEVNQLKPSNDDQLASSPHDSIEDIEDELQGPVLRRSAINRESESKMSFQNKPQQGYNSPRENRRVTNISVKPNEILVDSSPTGSVEDIEEDELQGPVLRRSAINKESEAKTVLQRPQSKSHMGTGSPLESRRMANTSGRRSTSPPTDEKVQVQPRSRAQFVGGSNGLGKDNIETSSQSSTDDMEEDDAPIVRRSALALPKPSSEGLSKQLWYSGPISEMNRQKTKSNPTAARLRRSASPSPDRRSKLQTKTTSAGVVRRSTGTRGSMEDLLGYDDNAPIQRRNLPQIPSDSNGLRSRLAKPDDNSDSKLQQKARSKIQNVIGGTHSPGNIVTRRSLLTPPSSGASTAKNSKVVARRRAPPQTNNLDDSWKDGCY